MREKPLHEKLGDLTSSVMALAYIGGGVFLILSSFSFRLLPIGSIWRYAFAGTLIVYGAFRGYRVLRGRNQEDS
jgi:Na+/alanine symporter